MSSSSGGRRLLSKLFELEDLSSGPTGEKEPAFNDSQQAFLNKMSKLAIVG
jgi:hypothetical protein